MSAIPSTSSQPAQNPSVLTEAGTPRHHGSVEVITGSMMVVDRPLNSDRKIIPLRRPRALRRLSTLPAMGPPTADVRMPSTIGYVPSDHNTSQSMHGQGQIDTVMTPTPPRRKGAPLYRQGAITIPFPEGWKTPSARQDFKRNSSDCPFENSDDSDPEIEEPQCKRAKFDLPRQLKRTTSFTAANGRFVTATASSSLMTSDTAPALSKRRRPSAAGARKTKTSGAPSRAR